MSRQIMSHHAEADTLIRTLAAVGAQIEPTSDWDQLVADITRGKASEPSKQLSTRSRLLATAAALLVVGAGGVALTTIVDTSPSEISASKPNFVLPGEVVLSEDPLTVLGALGPEPRFDTSDLGREIAFEPAQELDPELVELMDRIGLLGGSFDGNHVVKITALGTVEGVPWMIMITDGPNSARFGDEGPDANIRTRTILSPNGGGSHSADFVPVDSLELIIPEPNGSTMGGGYSVNLGDSTNWVEVAFMPAGTAVVSYADANQQQWMRPRSGIAAFPAHFEDGESFMVQAFDTDGVLIGGWSETVYSD